MLFVVALRLGKIRQELAKLPTGRVPKGEDWFKLSENWTSRIDELQRLKADLTDCISCGWLSLEQCALSNPDDRAGRLGPRYWPGERSKKAL